MSLIKRAILALVLIAGLSPAFAQAPAPVPALPDTERRTTYNISASTCACNVNFALYGDSTDYANWLTVWVNGVQMAQAGNWTITSPSGSLATLPRPITDAVLTFTNAQTGTIQIVGARRPRRANQFSENRGVAARDLNQVVTDLEAQVRELWDRQARTLQSQPGNVLGSLPLPANCQTSYLTFDNTGLNPVCAAVATTGTAIFPGSSGNGDLVTYNDTSGKSFGDLPKLSLPVFVGDSGSGGVQGYVPIPPAGSAAANKFLGAGGTWVVIPTPTILNYTAPWTGSVQYTQAKVNANVIYMTDFMGATTCDGVTDQYANMQAFLTAVAANGAANTGSITGIFAPGSCFVSAGTPTLTINSSTLAQNYRLVSNGTTILPDPTKALNCLTFTRGTFSTHGDEQRTITVEGLGCNVHNNANANWGFEVADTHVYLYRANCYAGDDGTTHNQGNFACFYWHQITSTDPNTGAFNGKLKDSICKGNGIGVSAVPICVRIDGSGGNSMEVTGNTFTQGGYGIRIFSPCSTVNANCAYMANSLNIQSNDIENFATECIEFHTLVPTISALVGGIVSGNTLENCPVGVDISTITQASAAQSQLAIGPNTVIGGTTYISNTHTITIKSF